METPMVFTTPRRYKRRGAYMTMRESPQGMEASIGCAAGDGMGGGIFAKTAKTPPLQSGVCGDFIALRIATQMSPMAAAMRVPCHPARLPPMGPYGFYNAAVPNRDAARHVATNALPPYAHARPTATMRVPCHTWRPRFL